MYMMIGTQMEATKFVHLSSMDYLYSCTSCIRFPLFALQSKNVQWPNHLKYNNMMRKTKPLNSYIISHH